MRIGERFIGPAHPPYVIAELGVNHDGSLRCALEMVDAAASAGADTIKLQLFSAATLLGRDADLAAYQRAGGASDATSMLRDLEMSIEDSASVARHAHARGLHAIVTVFSVELAGAVATIGADACKVASPDIVNRPLIDALRATDRPLLLSTGAATLEEIAATSRWLGESPHLLLHCVSAYPTPDEEAHLNGRLAICQVNARALGYSDHTTAVDTGALAVATGACLLEKHLTHDRNAAGPDHAASLEPAAFAEYVRLAHRAWRMCGAARKQVLPIEQEVRRLCRQSLTAARDLAAGHTLQRGDMTVRRPGTGIAAARLEEVIGCMLMRPIVAGQTLLDEDLAAAPPTTGTGQNAAPPARVSR